MSEMQQDLSSPTKKRKEDIYTLLALTMKYNNLSDRNLSS